MKKRLEKIMAMLFAAVLLLASTSCSDDDPEVPTPSEPLSTTLIGEWLLASSDASQWTTYQFTKSQLSSQWYRDGFRNEGTGLYFISGDKNVITASVVDSRGNQTYIDWKVTGVKMTQIDIDIYGDNGNTLIGNSSLYKIVYTQEMGAEESLTPEYCKYVGTNDISGYRSMDESIVKGRWTVRQADCRRGRHHLHLFRHTSRHCGHACECDSIHTCVVSDINRHMGGRGRDYVGA